MKNEDVEISSLLKSKDFDELNEGEQRFVLSEFGSRHKYDEMREALKDQSIAPDVQPPIAMRQNVMDAFDTFHSREKRHIGIWIPQRNWYRQPLVITLAAASILVAIFLILPSGPENLNRIKIAENKTLPKDTVKNSTKRDDSVVSKEQLNHVEVKAPKAEVEKIDEDTESNQEVLAQAKDFSESDEVESSQEKAAPIVSASVPKDLLLDTHEWSAPAESIAENENSNFAEDSGDNEIKNFALVQQDYTEKKSRSTNENMDMEAIQELTSAARSTKLRNQSEMKSDIFRVSQPLPDHYVAY